MATYIYRFILLGLLLIGTVEASQERFALVIGNGDYKDAPLRNSVNDARDMAAKLGQRGFTVTQLLNADQRKMENSIKQFSRQLREKSVGLFYFAGHGVEVGGTNYLIPVGADIDNEDDVKYEAVDAGRILDGMKSAGNDLNLVILDACRNNPYSRSFRGASRGLSRMMPASGSLIFYATEPGQTAEDGDGRNGVFTKYLMDAMDRPGLSVEKAFKQTAREVKHATGGKQKPWMEGMILGEFQFIAASAQRPKPGVSNADLLLWQSMQKCGTESCMKAYLDAYPNGNFSSLAKIQSQSSQQTVNGQEALQKADDTYFAKPGDAKALFRLHRQSAEQGNPIAMASLAKMYAQGRGIQKNNVEAKYWRDLAFAPLSRLAGQGDANARFELGSILNIVDKKPTDAIKWYRLSAEQGYAPAQSGLGSMYFFGTGVAKDQKEAAKWYRKAAEQGDANTQSILGWMYHNGKGVAKDEKEAAKWYRKAAEQGDASGQASLGLMHEQGDGVAKDDKEAVKWLRKAAEQGNAGGQFNLGWMYHNGKGVAKDQKEAVKWYRKAAEQGDARGQIFLGVWYKSGIGVAKDDKEAVKWYRKAAEQGYASGQFYLGTMYSQGKGVAKDDKEAVKWIRKAANQGNAFAQSVLGGKYQFGRGVAKDEKEAVKWYRKAAEQGYADAQSYLGGMYLQGRGVAQDYKEAVKWFRKAAEQGSAYGQYHLGRMYDMGKGVQRFPGKAAELMLSALGKDYAITKHILFEKPTQLSLETRKEIQRRLKEAGVYKGAIDGQFGPGTQRALRTWAEK